MRTASLLKSLLASGSRLPLCFQSPFCGGKLLPAGGKRRLCLLKFFFGLFPCFRLSKLPADSLQAFLPSLPAAPPPLAGAFGPAGSAYPPSSSASGMGSLPALACSRRDGKRILLLTGEIPDILPYLHQFSPRAGIPSAFPSPPSAFPAGSGSEPVWNSSRKMAWRSLVSASRSFRKSPWAIMAIWENWFRSPPRGFPGRPRLPPVPS